jgi:hypothetical protein
LLFSVTKSEVKRSKKRLFHFALKQNEKIGSETTVSENKNYWQRNKAKKH